MSTILRFSFIFARGIKLCRLFAHRTSFQTRFSRESIFQRYFVILDYHLISSHRIFFALLLSQIMAHDVHFVFECYTSDFPLLQLIKIIILIRLMSLYYIRLL